MYDRKGGRLYSYRTDEYYVDENGILKVVPKDNRYRYTPPESKIIRFNGFEYYKHDGIWYEVVSRPLAQIRTIKLDWMPLSYRMYYKDVFGVYHDECQRTYNEAIALVSKRQVGKKVIHKINDYLESKYFD